MNTLSPNQVKVGVFPNGLVRGGLLLRAASEDRELEYVAVAGAVRHGKRPAKLSPKKWGYKVLSGRMPDVEESVQSKGGRQSDT